MRMMRSVRLMVKVGQADVNQIRSPESARQSRPEVVLLQLAGAPAHHQAHRHRPAASPTGSPWWERITVEPLPPLLVIDATAYC